MFDLLILLFVLVAVSIIASSIHDLTKRIEHLEKKGKVKGSGKNLRTVADVVEKHGIGITYDRYSANKAPGRYMI